MLYLVCYLIYNLVCRLLGTDLQSGRRKTREPKEDNVTLGPAVREGEQVFGVAHIFASFNDTFIVSSNVLLILKVLISFVSC